MTAIEFPGPGFTSGQWELKTLATSMKPGQALWISGYFAGLDQAARRRNAGEDYAPLPLVGEPASPAAQLRSLTVLYGSETGNAAGLGRILRDAAGAKGIELSLIDMADYKIRKLKAEQDLIIITSTHGEGDPPFSGMGFFEFVEGRKAQKLPDLRYAVLALGDSTYEFFCEAGKRLDRRLAELGARRLRDRVDYDVDYDEPASAWTAELIERLAPVAAAANAAFRSPAAAQGTAEPAVSTGNAIFDSRNPFPAGIIDNIGLTGRAPDKYNLYLGGGFSGQRLNKMVLENVAEGAILDLLKDVLGHYAVDRLPGERFGDFTIRAGYVAEVKEGRRFND